MFHDEISEWLGANVDGLDYSLTDDTGNVFTDRAPSGPDRAVTVYVGPSPEPDSRLPYDPVNFQVVVRSDADGSWATAMWKLVRDALHGLRDVTLPGGTVLVYCLATQGSPLRLGDDDNGRPMYSCNFRGEIVATSSARP